MKPYSLEDIERYLQGKLSPAEMHELEKAAVQDPFLADAIEGYQSADLAIVKEDLAAIHEQLSSGPAKIVAANTKQNTWWRVAAALVLLAGAGILGSKLFTGENDNKDLVTQQPVSASQKSTMPVAAGIALPKITADTMKKDELLTKSSDEAGFLKKKDLTANTVSANVSRAEPVASLSVPNTSYHEQRSKPDTLFDKTVRDLLAANAFDQRSAGSSAQVKPGAQMGGLLNRNIDLSGDSKKENENNIPANANITVDGRQIPLNKLLTRGKNSRKDTIKPGTADMPGFSRTGYLKAHGSAITSLGGLSLLTVTGSVLQKDHSGISFDTPVLTDQKKMLLTLSEITTTSGTRPPVYDVMRQRTDTSDITTQTMITGYGSASAIKTSKKGLTRLETAAPGATTGKELGAAVRETFSVVPAGGWLDFTKYVNGKIAEETGTRHGVDQHGSVKVKMDISENGKASNVTILNSFNTRFNPIIIKAIRGRQRWVSSDHLAKKDHVFMIVF